MVGKFFRTRNGVGRLTRTNNNNNDASTSRSTIIKQSYNKNTNKRLAAVGILVGSKTYHNSTDARDDNNEYVNNNDDYDDEVQGNDNASALEIALNHSETDIGILKAIPDAAAAVVIGNQGGGDMKNSKFRRLQLPNRIIAKRKSTIINPTTSPSITSTAATTTTVLATKPMASGIRSTMNNDEKRDDTMIDATPLPSSSLPTSIIPQRGQDIVKGTGGGGTTTTIAKNLEQHGVENNSNNSGTTVSPLEVTITPELLSGLISKRYAQSLKAAAGMGNKKTEPDGKNKNGGSMKVKGYLRVVRKASGVKIVSGSPKIVKSYRLGTPTKTNTTTSNHTTLTFASSETDGLKSTGSIRIRVPPTQVLTSPPTTGTKGNISNGGGNNPKYDVLTFEVGVLTPDGIFPLGTTTYQPVLEHGGAEQMHQRAVLKIEPIRKGSIFQRRKIMGIGASSEVSTIIKDPVFHLQRKSTISMLFDVKEISENEYVSSIQKQKQEKSIGKLLPNKSNVKVDPPSPSSSNHVKKEMDPTLKVETMSNDPSKGKVEPSDSDVGRFIANPLSCCSGSYEETAVDDTKTLFTETVVNDSNIPVDNDVSLLSKVVSINDEDNSEAGIVPEAAPKSVAAESFYEIEIEIEDPGCCYLFSCCAGNNSPSDSHVDIKQTRSGTLDTTARQVVVPATGSMIYDAVVQRQYVESTEGADDEQQKIKDSRRGFDEDADADDILRSPSNIQDAQDMSIVGSRNCCMNCFGDEDVEKLRYPAPIIPIAEPNAEPEEIVSTVERTIPDNAIVTTPPRGMVEQQTLTTNEHEARYEKGGDDEADKEIDIGHRKKVTSRLDAVFDTMSSSYTDEDNDEDDNDSDDDASVFAVSYEDEFDDNVGCFYWMGVAGSEGLDTMNSLSVMSSESINESLTGLEVNANIDKIPISKSEELVSALPSLNAKNMIHHSISIS